jgi:uncharacterized zinc-type alcohol dehydrogenase-like protein
MTFILLEEQHMSQVAAYAAKAAGARLEPFAYELPALGPDEVDIHVTHGGICHSDIGLIDDHFKMARWPLVAGHEVVGQVDAVGSAVQSHKVGDRVGLGWQSASCGRCEWCLSGQEQLCASEQNTIVGRHGGFANRVRCQARFAIHLPEGLESHFAGPLMCAGTTVFAPLLHHKVGPLQRTAVVGIGGLGHLAVQYMAKLGCDVTAISSSHDKDAEARGFGANHVIATRGGDELAKAAGSFDFILCTASGDLPWESLINALRPKGTLCFAGIPANPIPFHPMALIQKEKRLVGGRTGSPADIQAGAEFAHRHGIKPLVERFKVADLNAAIDRVRSGKVRYRAVVDFID